MGDIRLVEASRFAVEVDGNFKTREDGEDLYIEGYFSVFDSEYQIWKDWVEIVKQGAFAESLAKDDIRALINHDTTLVLGRNIPGTLKLSEDAHGLFGRIKVNPKDQDAMNAWARVQRKDVTQCSFGFDVIDLDTEIRDGIQYNYLTKVKLYEVSVCTFPAYTATEVQARNAAAYKERRRQAQLRNLQAWKDINLSRLRKEQ